MKMSNYVLICLILLISGLMQAQNPQLTFAKRMGGVGAEGASAMAVDTFGNVYTTGTFAGTADFDPGPGIFNLSAPIFGIFVSKLDANGNFKWARYLGIGNGLGICVDHDGNVYTTGRFTGTSDFDPGPGIFNLTSVGNTDVFISKLDSLGNFVWAKSMGGTDEDVANDITFHESGLLGLTGYFRGSADFDPGSGSFNILADFIDVFVTVLDTDGNFQWANKLGGGKDDDGENGSAGNAIKFDEEARVVVTGYFSGTGAFGNDILSSFGNRDIFISKLSNDGDILWTKQMGGANNDQANDVFLDSKGDVYTTGTFDGLAEFNPDSNESFEMTGVQGDIFISKLDVDGNFMFAKQIGGAFSDVGQGIFVDNEFNIYTTGSFFQTADFDPGPETFSLSVVGSNNADIFISKLDENGDFVSAVKFGGLQNDEGTSIFVDKLGSIYGAGAFFGFVDFDPSEATEHLTSAGASDIFVLKLCQITTPVISGPEGFCPGESITLTTMQADSYLWSNGDTTQSIVVNEPGDFSITVSNLSGCSADSEVKTVLAFSDPDTPTITADGGPSICAGDTLTLSSSEAEFYLWSNGAITREISVTSSGAYSVVVTNEHGCFAESDVYHAQVYETPQFSFVPNTTSFCNGDSLLISVPLEGMYLWNTGDTTSSIVIKESGDYSFSLTSFVFGCTSYSDTLSVTVHPLPEIDLGDDISLISGETATLDAGMGFAAYAWSNGAFSSTITVGLMGEWCVTVTDSNGCTASDCVTVTITTSSNEENAVFKLTVSPNPSQDVIYVQSENFGISSLQLINNQGKMVLADMEISRAGEMRELNIESLASGLYFLKVESEGIVRTIPLIKK